MRVPARRSAAFTKILLTPALALIVATAIGLSGCTVSSTSADSGNANLASASGSNASRPTGTAAGAGSARVEIVPASTALAPAASAPTAPAAVGATPVVQSQSAGVDIEKATEGLPADIRAGIRANLADFEEMLKKTLAEPRDLIQLVDKQHALASDYVPPDLVNLSDYNLSLNRRDLQFRKIAMPDLLAMVHAAREEHITLLLSSTYRSYALQKTIFQNEVTQYGLKQAERESAHPGTSQHQLGTAIDFGSITEAFASTAAGKWLAANAWKYGFLISYPNGYEGVTGYMYEPWHFRYIGRAAAALGEKYFDGIQQYLLVFLHKLTSEGTAS